MQINESPIKNFGRELGDLLATTQAPPKYVIRRKRLVTLSISLEKESKRQNEGIKVGFL